MINQVELFGFVITRRKALAGLLSSVESARGWWPIVRESVAGAWQNNVEISLANVATHPTVFACATLIASDIAKMRLRLVQQDEDGIWNEAENPAFSPVLRKPNHFQNRIRFYETWVLSKALNGNAYVLKQRDNRRVVTALYVLDPMRVRPLVAPDGAVFYELKKDDLSRLPNDRYIVPASEIIHDLQHALFHPLVGLSPIFASGLAAVQGLNIQNNSTRFFGNGSYPGGVLTAPGAISQETADRLKAYWEENFTGDNVGKIAVLGDNLKYERMTVNAIDAQLIDQLKWTSETICSAFHVPAYMVGIGAPPNYNNIEAMNQQYYSQCLQSYIESIELALDEGLGLTEGEVTQRRYGTEFEIDDLLRMDSATKMKTATDGVKGAVFTPNDARQLFNKRRLTGGDTVYMQQQQFSLAALAERDQSKPFAKPTRPIAAPAGQPAVPTAKAWSDEETTEAMLAGFDAELEDPAA
jgi:HK97 family phage portal protein